MEGKKRLRSERSWCKQGIHYIRRREFEIVFELSGDFPVKKLCDVLGVNRSGFYKWKNRLEKPSAKMKSFIQDVQIFKEYHERFPSHGYRWLNAKIRLDEGLVMSDQRAHRCCKFAGIQSKTKHYRYRKSGTPSRVFPNLMLAGVNVDGPLQCVVSDMTAFRLNNVYHELTLYMDLWNNEILTYALSAKKGDRMTYIKGLNSLIELKKMNPDIEMVLHTDQGSVYASKEFNEVLPLFNITRSMSRAGTPTDNAAMESINGWIKEEMRLDFHLTGDNVEHEVDEYIRFYNEERPAYALNYLTPKQYRMLYQKV
ncbi:MAG: IS3 family transposase [Clostridiales bacterium]|nr:IS3 family transposase [Clostridiales bacterium]